MSILSSILLLIHYCTSFVSFFAHSYRDDYSGNPLGMPRVFLAYIYYCGVLYILTNFVLKI